MKARAEWESKSICRDVLAADHERDYQALGMFLLSAARKFVAREIFAVAIHPFESVAFHLYPACPVANRAVLCLIAHCGHVMWGKPTSATSGRSGAFRRVSPARAQ